MEVDYGSGHISKTAFLVTVWTAVGVVSLFSILRFGLRVLKLRKLYVEDAFHFLALSALITSAALYTYLLPFIYEPALEQNDDSDTIHGLLANFPQYLRYYFALSALFFNSTYAIRLGFLLFFKQFMNNIRAKIWWSVLVFVGLSYIARWASLLTIFGRPSNSFDVVEAVSPQTEYRIYVAIIYDSALDAVTYLCLMVIPVLTLRRQKVDQYEKTGLSIMYLLCAFLFVCLVMRAYESAMSILPLSGTIGGSRSSDTIYIGLWLMLEASTAISISCVPSLALLVSQRRNSTNLWQSPTDKSLISKPMLQTTNEDTVPPWSESHTRSSSAPTTASEIIDSYAGMPRTSESNSTQAPPQKRQRNRLSKSPSTRSARSNRSARSTRSTRSSRSQSSARTWSGRTYTDNTSPLPVPIPATSTIGSETNSINHYSWRGSGWIGQRGSLHDPLSSVTIPNPQILPDVDENDDEDMIYDRYSLHPLEEARVDDRDGIIEIVPSKPRKSLDSKSARTRKSTDDNSQHPRKSTDEKSTRSGRSFDHGSTRTRASTATTRASTITTSTPPFFPAPPLGKYLPEKAEEDEKENADPVPTIQVVSPGKNVYTVGSPQEEAADEPWRTDNEGIVPCGPQLDGFGHVKEEEIGLAISGDEFR